MENNGTNFHKMIDSLSTNALKYLLNLISKELKKRAKDNPVFENKELPILSFDHNTVLIIKNEYFNITSYNINGLITFVNDHQISLDLSKYDWLKMYNDNIPIIISLKNIKSFENKDIIIESRSKIIWLSKLLNDLSNTEKSKANKENSKQLA